MTIRKIPKIEAFARVGGIDFDPPVEASRRYTPVKAAVDDARSLNIFGAIGEDYDGSGVSDRLVSAALRRMGSGPVTVNINSRGGDFFTGVNIYNQLREHDGEVTARVLGLAASAASVIAMASDNLLVARSAFLMIHNSHGLVMGNADEMESAAAMFRQFDGAMAGVYSEQSGMDRDDIEEYMRAETFFNGEEAVEAGLADGLLASDDVVEDEEPQSVAAYRRLDVELAQKGIPRAERRALLSQVISDKGTPRATEDVAANVTPRADANPIADIIRDISVNFSSHGDARHARLSK